VRAGGFCLVVIPAPFNTNLLVRTSNVEMQQRSTGMLGEDERGRTGTRFLVDFVEEKKWVATETRLGPLRRDSPNNICAT
jgi:hypothetical protein